SWVRFEVAPARPNAVVTTPGPVGGPFDVAITDGPALGVAMIQYGPAALTSPSEIPTLAPNFVPLFSALDPSTTVLGPALALDANGDSAPTTIPAAPWLGATAVQAVCVDALLGVVGTSTTVVN